MIQVPDYNFPGMTLYAFHITEFSGCPLLCWTILIRPSSPVSVHTHRWTDISEYHIIFCNLRDGRRQGDRTQVLSSILHGFFFFLSCRLERRLSDDEVGFIPAIHLTALHHCEGFVFFKLFTLLAKYLLQSDLGARLTSFRYRWY